MVKIVLMLQKPKQINSEENLFNSPIFSIAINALIAIFLMILCVPIIIITIATIIDSKPIDFSQFAGAIGDTFGGSMGPPIAFIGAILTFLAFYIQYRANDQQRNDLKMERFENKYYELLKLQRANVEEMDIAGRISGRKCFVPMFYELRYIYTLVKLTIESQHTMLSMQYYEEVNVMDFSYKIFFYGIGYNSEKNYVSDFNEIELSLFEIVKENLEQGQKEFENSLKINPSMRYCTHKMPLTGKADFLTIDFFYYPFDGHLNLLGHYHRHLFHTAKFIISQDFIREQEKYQYIKTLRAQLSDFEQLMLYYNSLAWFKTDWNELFTDYMLIKNLPIPLADFDVRPEERFKDDIVRIMRERNVHLFEHHDSRF